MLSFFLHKKFWMPLVLLVTFALLAEWLLSMNLWKNLVLKNSYLGNGIYREKAIKDFGLANIEWITVGDSKIDWGIEHDRIKKAAKKEGINHIRMSFEASNFMAIQATVNWSIANMPHLKGIVLGVSEDSFGHFSDVTKQYKVSWPFRAFYDREKYQYSRAILFWQDLWYRLAIVTHYKDIKNFLMNPFVRIKSLDKKRVHLMDRQLNFNRHIPKNSCGYGLSNLEACVATAERLKQNGQNFLGAQQFIINQCGNSYAKNRVINRQAVLALSEPHRKQLVHNWQLLFRDILNNDVALTLVVLPEHGMLDYVVKPNNTIDVFREVVANVSNIKGFDLLDLRDSFNQQPLSECRYYSDILHFNNTGKIHITNSIIKHMYPQDESIMSADAISQEGFEQEKMN